MTLAPAWPPYPSRSAALLMGARSGPPARGGLKLDFSPLLIAMMVAVAAAFLVVTYSRLISRQLVQFIQRYRHWRHRRRRLRFMMPSYSYSVTTFSNLESPSFPFESSFSPGMAFSYGLDDSTIKTIPLSLYTTHTADSNQQTSTAAHDCAVCLLEFEENDYVRTLPLCSHTFHLDCIDIWLRSHANCPLCRANIFCPDSPFVPVMAARIRPSLDDAIFANSVALLEPLNAETTSAATLTEIMPYEDERLPRRNSLHNLSSNYSEDNINLSSSNRVLKRSYSFGFERTSFLAASETNMVTEPATASPWKLRRAGFWSKRPLTPFKSRVFSSRYNRGGTMVKSPAFFRRRSSGGGMVFPWSERFSNVGGTWASSSSRRSKLAVSPMFARSTAAAFSSSRLRCGDPEALLSPERLNRR